MKHQRSGSLALCERNHLVISGSTHKGSAITERSALSRQIYVSWDNKLFHTKHTTEKKHYRNDTCLMRIDFSSRIADLWRDYAETEQIKQGPRIAESVRQSSLSKAAWRLSSNWARHWYVVIPDWPRYYISITCVCCSPKFIKVLLISPVYAVVSNSSRYC